MISRFRFSNLTKFYPSHTKNEVESLKEVVGVIEPRKLEGFEPGSVRDPFYNMSFSLINLRLARMC